MSANKLLLLMSTKSQGSWQQFRAAVEELHISTDYRSPAESPHDGNITGDLPLYHKLRLNLQRLAHVEFRHTGAEQGWRVGPPTIATIQHQDQILGVLAGARSRILLDKLREVAGEIPFTIEAQEYAPDRITLTADDCEQLRITADNAGINLQEEAPISLLAALPCVDDYRLMTSRELPVGPGWEVERFSPADLRWTNASQESAQQAHSGLFRFRLGFQQLYYLRKPTATFEIPVEMGKYIVMRRLRRKILAYDPDRRRLVVPAICRPPLLIERALILCSGRLPRYNSFTRSLEYADIPLPVAHIAAQLLRQEIA